MAGGGRGEEEKGVMTQCHLCTGYYSAESNGTVHLNKG